MKRKKREIMKIFINGGEYTEISEINEVFKIIFELNMSFYSIMNIEAIKNHIKTTIELIEETSFSITNKTIKSMKGVIQDITDKDLLIKFITNFVLSQEGLAPLHGFGCATTINRKIKTRLKLDPEKKSIVSINK